MSNFNLLTGRKGEELAAKYLKKKGFQVLEKNFKNRFGEIDLIIFKKGLLIFVEVKTRLGSVDLNPEWAINLNKVSRVQKMAQVFLAQNKIDYQDLRIDVVCVCLSEEKKLLKIDHYENISEAFPDVSR